MMNDVKKLVIIGAGGHGRVVADIAKKSDMYKEIVFLDDSEVENKKVWVSGKVRDYTSYINNSEFIVAIGNNKVREKIQKELEGNGAQFATLIHPNATVCEDVKVGRGTVIMAGAVINSCAEIGNGVIINTCSSVDHDCTIGDYTHVSVGAHISGTVSVGRRAFLCAGVTVSNNVGICDDCIVGAGAVVVKNITEAGTFIGVPAKKK